MTAFLEGADAVYLGLKSFSARAMATNFSFEDLSKLRQLALSTHKKIYVTVNTLVDEDQLDSVVTTLRHLAFIGCDGVIVQDLGVVNLIKRYAPSLPLHGSTQLAIHTVEGVRELVRLGFERVVLARELTLHEIKTIREACPDVQLKVFIHGALCYSVSGLCMASEQLCSRSANCGSCAQICRNYWTVTSDTKVSAVLSPIPKGVKTGWFFSMSDLKAGTVAKELAELGIDSLKVEGRMKSPAYTGLSARYYRAILEGREETKELEEALGIVFSRRQTGGWLSSYGRDTQDFSVRKAPTLGSTSYPGHRGVMGATVHLVREESAIIQLQRELNVRDGLMYFIPGTKEPVDTVKFGVSYMLDHRGKSITKAYPQETVTIPLPKDSPLPHAGEQLYIISRHDQNEALKSEALPLLKHSIDLVITLSSALMTIQSSLLEAAFPLSFSKAQKEQDVKKNLETLFSQSDTSNFSLGKLKVYNNTKLPLSSLFIPLSELKAIRRSWYEQLDRKIAMVLSEKPVHDTPNKLEFPALPPRSLLQTAEKLPYLDLSLLRKKLEAGVPAKEVCFSYEERLYLPLSPIMFNTSKFFADLAFVIEALENQGVLPLVSFGLNNLGQIPFFRERQLPVFFDVYLYLANSEAAKLALTLGLNFKGGYLWMERSSTDLEHWPFIPTPVDAAFHPPLFISRSCFRHDSLMLSCENCPHRGSWYVEGNGKQYHVMVEDCITTVVQA